MNVAELIPKDAKEFSERNAKYAKIIAASMASSKEEREKAKKELKLAETPKEEIYSESSLKLYRFTPVSKKLHKTPLLIVPSLILRYYVMDLMKGHSLIEHLVEQGIDTYLIDWGTPGDEHGELTFDYYIDTFIRRCVRKVSRRHGREPIDLFGQCLGGTMAAIYAALHQEQIRRLGLITAPVDFRDAGLLALWTKKETFKVDKVVEAFGPVVPASFVHACFQFLDVKATVERYKKLYNNVLDDNFLYLYRALDHWLNDQIPFPGQVFRKFIRGLYQDNQLVKGEFMIHDRAVSLRNITCPTLSIAAEFDHVFPECAASGITGLVRGSMEYHKVPAGHVTLIVLFPQRHDTYRIVTEFFTR
jgi:polyhydroxyalkanoate synthase subunit PhaC